MFKKSLLVISFASFFGPLCTMQHAASTDALAHAPAEVAAPTQEDVPECSICLQNITNPHDIVHGAQLFGCDARHIYDAQCIALWMQRSGENVTCPICRAPLRAQLPEALPIRVKMASITYLRNAIDAAAAGNYDSLQQALDAAVDTRHLLLAAVDTHRDGVAPWLIARGADVDETLVLAVQLRRVTAIRDLIYIFGADVHAHNEQAILAAVTSDQPVGEIIDFLCEAGGWRTKARLVRLGLGMVGRKTWQFMRERPLTSLAIGAGFAAVGFVYYKLGKFAYSTGKRLAARLRRN